MLKHNLSLSKMIIPRVTCLICRSSTFQNPKCSYRVILEGVLLKRPSRMQFVGLKNYVRNWIAWLSASLKPELCNSLFLTMSRTQEIKHESQMTTGMEVVS